MAKMVLCGKSLTGLKSNVFRTENIKQVLEWVSWDIERLLADKPQLTADMVKEIKYLSGLSWNQIAKILGVHICTVHTQIRKGGQLTERTSFRLLVILKTVLGD